MVNGKPNELTPVIITTNLPLFHLSISFDCLIRYNDSVPEI